MNLTLFGDSYFQHFIDVENFSTFLGFKLFILKMNKEQRKQSTFQLSFSFLTENRLQILDHVEKLGEKLKSFLPSRALLDSVENCGEVLPFYVQFLHGTPMLY